jgi:hypothetical protein
MRHLVHEWLSFLLLSAMSALLTTAREFHADTASETLAERLAAIRAPSKKGARLGYTISKEFPQNTNVSCHQVDGKSG